jgi:dihydroorotase
MLGLPLEEALAAATCRPAQILGLDKQLGTLRPGTIADIAVFELQEGAFEFVDSYQNQRRGTQRLVNVVTVKDGQIWQASGSQQA